MDSVILGLGPVLRRWSLEERAGHMERLSQQIFPDPQTPPTPSIPLSFWFCLAWVNFSSTNCCCRDVLPKCRNLSSYGLNPLKQWAKTKLPLVILLSSEKWLEQMLASKSLEYERSFLITWQYRNARSSISAHTVLKALLMTIINGTYGHFRSVI